MKLTFSEIFQKSVGVLLCDFGGLGYPNDALIPSVDKVEISGLVREVVFSSRWYML